MLLRILLIPGFLFVGLVSGTFGWKLTTLLEWKWVDYDWNSEADRTAAIESGDYDYTKSIIIDAEVTRDNKFFVTVVRREGVPASLNRVTRRIGSGGPLLRPYPDWSWTRKGDCNGITSVYRIAIDECNRLWVMDNGKIGTERICPPQLLAFNLTTDRLLRRIRIPDSVARNPKTGKGLLVTPIVETEGRQCEKTQIYIADVQGNAMVVYNGTSFWRLESLVYGPQASATNIEIAGESFDLPDGVLGMALSPKNTQHESRWLVSRPLASYDMVFARTTELKSTYGGAPVTYRVISGMLPSQAVAMAFSSKGVLFIGLTKETALACWNIDNPTTKENVLLVDQNRTTHQFHSGLKVVRAERGDEYILTVTNRYQKIALGTQDFGEVNFRVMIGSVDVLLKETNSCTPTANHGNLLNRRHSSTNYKRP